MRISTSTIFDLGVANLQEQSARLMRVQEQLGANRRILTPADDPSGSARVLELSQAQAINQQYDANIGAAGDSLAFEESILASVTDLLQSAKDAANAAGNGAYNASDRITLAHQLRGQYQQLVGLANSTDSGGQYLFAGYRSASAPFTQKAPGSVTYNGDQGQRLMQVGPTRQIAVSDSGDGVFGLIPSGNGSFVTQARQDNAATAQKGNTGSALIDGGNVLDAAKWNSAGNNKNYTIKFAVSAAVPPVTSYDIVEIVNGVSGNSLLTGTPPGPAPYPRTYTSGSAIALSQTGQAGPPQLPGFDYGAELTISGAPADGDSFTVAPSKSEDVFKTISDLAGLLESGTGSTALTNELNRLQRNLDNAFNNALAVRSEVGTRMKELDGLKNGNDSLALQYSQSLSRVQDLDYAKAASEFTQQQVTLQAAQQSFVKVAGLSLFNYL